MSDIRAWPIFLEVVMSVLPETSQLGGVGILVQDLIEVAWLGAQQGRWDEPWASVAEAGEGESADPDCSSSLRPFYGQVMLIRSAESYDQSDFHRK